MKTCKKCDKRKPTSEYYRHKNTPDGRFGSCKECIKKQVTKYRAENLKKVRKCALKAQKRPERVKANRENTKRSRKKFPKKYVARYTVYNAIKAGTLIRPADCSYSKCREGGQGRIEAHHEDYDKLLIVKWLCTPCHAQLHRGTTPEARAIQAIIVIPMAA